MNMPNSWRLRKASEAITYGCTAAYSAENWHFDSTSAVALALTRADRQEIELVCAATICAKPFDLRFSNDNQNWAKEYPMSCVISVINDEVHSGLLDMFVSRLREEDES